MTHHFPDKIKVYILMYLLENIVFVHMLNVAWLSDLHLSLFNCPLDCGDVSVIFINTVFVLYAAVNCLLALPWDGSLRFLV